jgi:lipopolysaccharide transport system ATP-binding protein
MSHIINVDNVSKLYYIGASQGPPGSLRESIMDVVKNPFRLFRRNGHSRGRELWALKDVSFGVEEGEIVGIIGRNGAGKSTLLKILSRITEPTQGRVELYGRIASLLEVGTGFHPELTGRENVFLNGAILGMRKEEIKRKFDEIVAFSEVEKFIDTAVKYYSSGMYVRLAFAVAAHLDPEILIIDEVLAVGDVNFQKKCLGKMDEVARGGRTVIFVSHSSTAVARICTSCIWIEEGSVVVRGTPAEVVVDYLGSGNTHEANGIITDDMHDHQLQEIVYKRVALIDHNDKVTTNAYFGDVLRFEIDFEVRAPVTQARLGLAIVRQDDIVVGAIHHTESPTIGLLNLSAGSYTARVEVNLPVAPGKYVVSLFGKPEGGFWNSSHRSYDYIKCALSFTVEEVTRAAVPALMTGAIVSPTSVWEIGAL